MSAASAELVVRLLENDEEAQLCARLMSTTDPWLALNLSYEQCLGRTRDDSRERYVAYQDEKFVGFVFINLQGPFVGYLQTIGVVAEFRGSGIGHALIEFAETRIFREHPNVFLCVTSFNVRAKKLYESLGYKVIGTIDNFLLAGEDEILMRKTRGPIIFR